MLKLQKIMTGSAKQTGSLYYKCNAGTPSKKRHFLSVSEKKVDRYLLAHVCADLVQICAEKQEKTEKKGFPF